MTYSELKAKADEMAVPLKYAVECRINCLRAEMQRLDRRLCEWESMEPESMVEQGLTMWQWGRLTQDYLRCGHELRSLTRATRKRKAPDNEITPEMVARAKEYPIDRLVEFDRHGNSVAFCHADKSPSLHWNRKANRAHCFPCGKSFDSIAVLMERDSRTFREAVMELQ